jgi:neutral ceramidase
MVNNSQKLNCGVSRIDITPPVGLELSGGAFGPSQGILHPLSAKALYFESQDKRLLLISADLVGWDTAYADQIRKNLSYKYDIPLNAILLAATHTHAGPATVHFRNWGEVDDAYCHELETKLDMLTGEAIHSKVPAISPAPVLPRIA